MNLKLSFLASGIVFTSLVVPSLVWAQTESPAAAKEVVTEESVNETEGTVISKPLLEDEIKNVEQTYKGQLQVYRTAQNRYQIAKQQYTQLQTLTSLEEAVKTTREAMVARNDVLLTYLTLLRLNLIQATGINLTQKEPTITALEGAHKWLEQHQDKAKSANDRYQILEVADEFSQYQTSIAALSYKTTSLLAIGKLQSVYDKTLLLSEQVETEVVMGKEDVKQEERKRAKVEIERELSDVQRIFSELNNDIEDEDTSFSRSYFNTLQRELGSIYSRLAQTLSHLSELVRL